LILLLLPNFKFSLLDLKQIATSFVNKQNSARFKAEKLGKNNFDLIAERCVLSLSQKVLDYNMISLDIVLTYTGLKF